MKRGFFLFLFLVILFIQGCQLGNQTSSTTEEIATIEVSIEVNFNDEYSEVFVFSDLIDSDGFYEPLNTALEEYLLSEQIPEEAFSFEEVYWDVDFEELYEPDDVNIEDVDEIYLYLEVINNSFSIRYEDEEGHLIESAWPIAYGTDLSEYIEVVHYKQDMEYYDWESIDDENYTRMPAQDIILVGKERYRAFEIKYYDIEGNLLKTNNTYNEEEIRDNPPIAPDVLDKEFVMWKIDNADSTIFDIKFVPLYQKSGIISDVSDLDLFIYLDYLDLGNEFIVHEVISNETYVFDKATMEISYTIDFPDYVSTVEIASSIYSEDFVIFHVVDLEYSYGSFKEYNYLLFYSLTDRDFYRTISLGDNPDLSNFSLATLLNDDYFMYLFDNLLYVFIQDKNNTNQRVMIYDINDEEYLETISFSDFLVPIEYMGLFLSFAENLDFVMLSHELVNELFSSKYILYGNLDDISNVTKLEVENSSNNYGKQQLVYDNNLITGIHDENGDFIGIKIYNMIDDSTWVYNYDELIKPNYDNYRMHICGDFLILETLTDVTRFNLLDFDDSSKFPKAGKYLFDEDYMYNIYQGELVRTDFVYDDFIDFASDLPIGIGDYIRTNEMMIDGDRLVIFSVVEEDSVERNIVQIYDKFSLSLEAVLYPDLFGEEIPDDLLKRDNLEIAGDTYIFSIKYNSSIQTGTEKLVVYQNE